MADVSNTIRLGEIAHARSGDKGNHANVGVIAYSQAGFDFLKTRLTVECVESYFASLEPKLVERFELPGICAINFLLHEILAGGASRSLRIDTQGKILAPAILEMEITAPENLAEMLPT